MRREETGEQLALGRESRPGAGAAERRGHRRDHADLAPAVAVAEAIRDLARVVRLQRLEREGRIDERDDLRARHDVVQPPAVCRPDVHVLDVAQDEARVARPARHRDDRGLVDAAPDHHVDLDRRQAGGAGGRDPVEHPGQGHVDAAHGAEDRVVEGVEADRDPVQPGVGERGGQRPERRSVGGKREVSHALDHGQLADQVRQVPAHRRLAPGDPELLHAETDEDAGQPRDLLVAQDLGSRQEREVAAEDLRGHAVGAAEVAAVGHRDPEVTRKAAQPVARRPSGALRARIRRGAHAPDIVAVLSRPGPRRPGPRLDVPGPGRSCTGAVPGRTDRDPGGTTVGARWYH